MSPELTLLYVHGDSIGYGRLGVKLADALARLGVEVYDDLGEPEDARLNETDAKVAHGRRSKKTNVVCWVSVPTHARCWWEGQHAAVFTMWEATVLPESFRDSLHNFQTIIVPSQHNVELFSRYHPNVAYVPLGVDPHDWHYEPRQMGSRFNFLCAGSGERKGVDLAVQAFKTVFRDRKNRSGLPRPHLLLKNPKGEIEPATDISVISGRLSSRAEIDLYTTAHCYVQPSRGEGFGLQPLQAMAQGIPTILTGAHGHEAFCDLGIALPYGMSKAAYFIYGDAGEWWEPDFETLCETMWEVYTHYDDHLDLAERSARIIARDWTWDRTAEVFAAVFDQALTRPYEGTGELVRPEVKRFLSRVNKAWAADICGVHYQFHPGRDYWELADVKRILFEAGLLDLSCLTTYSGDFGGVAESGLTESQLARIPEYSAAHAHCETCGQKLGGPTRADAIYAELTG